MKRKHCMFFGFIVMMIMVFFTMIGCQSLSDSFKDPEFPSEFRGTWKRAYQSVYTNTLTLTSNTIKDSGQNYYWALQRVSGNAYKVKSSNSGFIGDPLIINFENGYLVFSNDDASPGEDNWDGRWEKQ